jgi:hypothetical protein
LPARQYGRAMFAQHYTKRFQRIRCRHRERLVGLVVYVVRRPSRHRILLFQQRTIAVIGSRRQFATPPDASYTKLTRL